MDAYLAQFDRRIEEEFEFQLDEIRLVSVPTSDRRAAQAAASAA